MKNIDLINWEFGDLETKQSYFKCLRSMISELRTNRVAADILNKYNVFFLDIEGDKIQRVNLDFPKIECDSLRYDGKDSPYCLITGENIDDSHCKDCKIAK